MSDTEQKEPEPKQEEPEPEPEKVKKTADMKAYLHTYYIKNKQKYIDSNRKRRERLGLNKVEKPNQYKLTIIDSKTGQTLYTRCYKSQKEICDELNLPAHKVCRIYKKRNSPNYIIEKI